MTDPSDLYAALEEEIGTVLIGLEDQVGLLTIAALTRGHVLLEGVPGVAKTSLANVFAQATGLEYNRVQMTPDILPADITGTKVYREETGHFEVQRGPVFSNVVVADEINRATPKTQSALLEAMEENRVTIEGDTYDLPDPFMVIATQNPIEMEGIFELPEAQRDRFQLKVSVDLPSKEDELALVDRFHDDPTLAPEDIEQVITHEEFRAAREAVADVHVDDSIEEYIVDLVDRTREHADVDHGASPRATLAFLNTAKARAAIFGRDYVIPDDVKAMAEPILIHRLILSTEAELGEADRAAVVEDILDSVVPPGGEESDPDLDGDAEEIEQD
ncbi:AAA family ATPase [Halosimplex pelagicum]|uniref:MoxR family ATPase n=1 Tax=Halosimplex pelagicum TaxID=869886 RepID=A0A7D5SUI2_9EURY|nr:MoxR family ATPase [Halosimplex pelagicum]QLH81347.1 MoxR family ATPase [Halosimplex pelagicum]